ncbi:MAG: enoyl- hydratase [Lasallia pustulata]|uniref:Enoyl-hydratase n=1 Tax=Lasallia pustulata TaxID=136370 RepID=A0A5M8Q0F7_9LECA|nr:MAG: enoyl- hydratase [Lasallia pustulata]
MSTPHFSTPPPATSFTKISFPTPRILLVTLSRPKQLNCINRAGHIELDALWTWLDNEPSLRVGIITGEGRAFCAGADLKGTQPPIHPFPPRALHPSPFQQKAPQPAPKNESPSTKLTLQTPPQRMEQRPTLPRLPARPLPPSGFGGLSRRAGKKPIIAAINGLCLGGGCEISINADMVLASAAATFGLPEVKRGVVALAGALPRLVRTVGRQRAMEMALTGRTLSAHEAREWGLVNRVVGEGESVVAEAVRWAEVVGGNSPDSVVVKY